MAVLEGVAIKPIPFLPKDYTPDKERKSLVADRLGGKVTKEEANYRPHDNADRKDTCAECDSYLTPGEAQSSCRKVAGLVEAEDTCDLWAARVSEGTGIQPQTQIHIEITKG